MCINIVSVFGTRPQYIKHAVLLNAFKNSITSIDTSQHYDHVLSGDIIKDLKLPTPQVLSVAFKNTNDRIAAIQKKLIIEFTKINANVVIVYGDTDSTMAAAVAAKKCNCLLVHIEAGERSYNIEMPEEINRIETDKLANLLFCVSKKSIENLTKEKINTNAFFVGDLMKDLLLKTTKKLVNPLVDYPYYFATIHRNYTQNNKTKLEEILSALNNLPNYVIFSLHPSTQKKMEEFKINLVKFKNIHFITAPPYTASIQYQKFSMAIITDSGGMQKEAYWLKKKCITIRKETEWTETLLHNWNTLVYDNLKTAIPAALNLIPIKHNKKLYGDGKAATLIKKNIQDYIKNHNV
jgi:UDP-GlcNAc3NAcA epimerase